MRRSYLAYSSLGLALVFGVGQAHAQQGFGTEKPSKVSVIDMQSGSKGLLIPRVALEKLDQFGPIKGETDGTKTNSLLVYNTANTAQTDNVTGVTPGYYYWTVTGMTGNVGRWNRLIADSDAAALALLAGDVTGALGNNKVDKLQGNPLVFEDLANGNFLFYNGTSWVNKTPLVTDFLGGQDVTAASDKVKLGGTPTGAALKAFSIDVDETKINIKANQIIAEKENQILVTFNEGGKLVTKWVDKDVAIQAEQKNTVVAAGVGVSVDDAFDATTKTTTYTVSANPAGIALGGDITGNADATTVSKLQGNDLDVENPEVGYVLTFEGGKWIAKKPTVDTDEVTNGKAFTSTDLEFTGGNHTTALLKDVTVNIAPKAVTADKMGAGDGDAGKVPVAQADGTVKYENIGADNVTGNNLTAVGDVGKQRITITGGEGTVLKSTTLDVNEANLNLANIGGELPVDKLVSGTENQVLITVKEGDKLVTKWANKDAKTNSLVLNEDNKLVSTVNGVASDVDLTGKVNTAMLAKDAVTADKINEDVAGEGLTKNATNGALDVNFNKVKEELAKGAVSSNSITVNNGAEGTKTTFSDVKLEIKPGAANQVMVTAADGNSTTWVDQSTLVPATTVSNSSSGNSLTTTVNGGTGQAVNIINSNTLTLGTDNKLVSTVNGVASEPGVDLKDAVERLQKTTTVKAGDNVTVTPSTVNATGNTEYTVSVSKEDIQKNQNKTVVKAGAGISVATPTTVDDITTYTVSADPAGISLAGDVTGTANATVVGKIQQTPVSATKPTREGQALVFDGTSWTPGTPKVDVGNVTDAKNLKAADPATATIEVVEGGTKAVLVETSLRVKAESITTSQIKDGTIAPADIANSQNPNQVLVTGDNSKPEWIAKTDLLTVNNGLTRNPNNAKGSHVQLGGPLTIETTTIGAAIDKRLAITGLQASENVDRIVTVSPDDGVLRQMKAAMPKFFYMPSVMMPTAADQLDERNAPLKVTPHVSHANGVFTVKLYEAYDAQFGSPKVSSGKVTKLPVLPVDQLEYHVTWFDPTVYTDVTVNAQGVLTYKISRNADVTVGSFMNIVFAVKP